MSDSDQQQVDKKIVIDDVFWESTTPEEKIKIQKAFKKYVWKNAFSLLNYGGMIIFISLIGVRALFVFQINVLLIMLAQLVVVILSNKLLKSAQKEHQAWFYNEIKPIFDSKNINQQESK